MTTEINPGDSISPDKFDTLFLPVGGGTGLPGNDVSARIANPGKTWNRLSRIRGAKFPPVEMELLHFNDRVAPGSTRNGVAMLVSKDKANFIYVGSISAGMADELAYDAQEASTVDEFFEIGREAHLIQPVNPDRGVTV